jgi:hypothetical protein
MEEEDEDDVENEEKEDDDMEDEENENEAEEEEEEADIEDDTEDEGVIYMTEFGFFFLNRSKPCACEMNGIGVFHKNISFLQDISKIETIQTLLFRRIFFSFQTEKYLPIKFRRR